MHIDLTTLTLNHDLVLYFQIVPHLINLVACVQFRHSVVSHSLRPHGLQHTRLPRLSPTPEASSNSCPSSWWCHPTISSSVIPLSSCPQSFPASGSFPVTQFFASGGQSAKSLQSYLTLFDLWTVVSQAALLVGFSRHEYRRGLFCPLPRDLPNLAAQY